MSIAKRNEIKLNNKVVVGVNKNKNKECWAILQSTSNQNKNYLIKDEKLFFSNKKRKIKKYEKVFFIERSEDTKVWLKVLESGFDVLVNSKQVIEFVELNNHDTISSLNDWTYNFILLKTEEVCQNLPPILKSLLSLGKGSFGEVFSAFLLEDERCCAVNKIEIIKKKKIYKTKQEELREEFDKLKDLHCRNIICVYSFMTRGPCVFLEMELCVGENLANRLAKGSLEITEMSAKVVFYQVFKALSFLHSKRITHRNVNLNNILLKSRDKYPIVKLTGFEYACYNTTSPYMTDKAGKFEFCAPEIMKIILRNRCVKYTNTVDTWSTTICLYYFLTLKFPFDLVEIRTAYMKFASKGSVTYHLQTMKQHSFYLGMLIISVLTLKQNDRPKCKDILDSLWFTSDAKFHSIVQPLAFE